MLFERRVYTLPWEAMDRYWAAQVERGFKVIQPVMERLIGTFVAKDDALAHVTHLYRYDSYEDWHQRMYGLAGNPGVKQYLSVVRPLMVRQENTFLLPSPLTDLSPLWNSTCDWRPGQSANLAVNWRPGDVLEEQVLNLSVDGGWPAYWAAFDRAFADGVKPPQGHLGAFSTLVGRQHQILTYQVRRADDDLRERPSFGGDSLDAEVGRLVMERVTRRLQPAPIAEMVPILSALRTDDRKS